jgi:FkbM family methyltransferase
MNTFLKTNEYQFIDINRLTYYIYNHSYFSDDYGFPSGQLIDEPSEMSNLLKLTRKISKDKIILDVGSNCGLFCIPLSLYGYDVIGFEPVKSCVELIDIGIKKNNCKNLMVHNFALSNFNGEREIFIPNCTDNSSFNKETAICNMKNKDFQTEVVKCVKFDDWFQDDNTKKVGLIKLDVQGYEYEVLEGMINYLSKSSDIYILIEWSEKHTRLSGFSLNSIKGLLNKLGFVLTETTNHENDFLFYKK